MKVVLDTGEEVETNYKVLYSTTLRCDYCRGQHLLKKIENSHGDHLLKCFDCNPTLTWYLSDGSNGVPMVYPPDHVHYPNQQAQNDRSWQIYCTIKTEANRYVIRNARGRPRKNFWK